MEFLRFLEGIRNPVFDFFFSIITLCGEETVFMAVGLIVFWCVSKAQGYYLLCTGFFGTVINQFLKIFIRVPRPWVLDPKFTAVESAKPAASGYSFPSGHTQTSVGLFGGIARANRNLPIFIVSVALCILVPFSRMYLGVHTPDDVGASIIIALFLVLVGYPLFMKAIERPHIMYIILAVLTLVMTLYLIFINFYEFPSEVYLEENLHNLLSAKENGFTLMGCTLGFIVVYTADLLWIKFDTKAVWWVQIIKVVGGLLLVLATKELLKIPLNAIMPQFEDSFSRLIRYFAVAVVGGVLWPLTFRLFNKLSAKTKKEKCKAQ